MPGPVFILCGARFDEVAVAIFVTELRQAGLRVVVVGLAGPVVTGAHGLTIRCDKTLSEVMDEASTAAAVVWAMGEEPPGEGNGDPRIGRFWASAQGRACMLALSRDKVTADQQVRRLVAEAMRVEGDSRVLVNVLQRSLLLMTAYLEKAVDGESL